jgi:hypothetical protein
LAAWQTSRVGSSPSDPTCSTDPPPGRRIVQISSAANAGGVVLFILCDDGSAWSASAFHEPKWHLAVRPRREM